jgi:hypothetical protein
MMIRAALAISIVLGGAAAAAAGECPVPKGMKKDQKIPCVRAAAMAMTQPTLTLDQLTNGPGFDSADPVKSRWAYFTGADSVACYLRPHYAFKSVKGQSLKFQCWQMNAADHTFFSTKGAPLTTGEVKVVLRKNSGGENRGDLFARSDTANAKEIKADRIKVKYLRPAHPNHDKRFNEVFTEIAASRILWALGFPADHQYPVGTASCVGCTADPFKDNLKDNTALLAATPATFKVALVERQIDWDDIDPEGDETWSWTDAANFYANGFTRQQQVEYDAYRMALALFNYHNPIDIQNRLACAEWKADASNPKICTKPMMFVQDLGSTFGKDAFLFANSRGNFKDWQSQTVFKKAEKCELRNSLAGGKQPLKEAQDMLKQRVALLDRARVRAIFQVARFDMMDQEQLARLRSSGAADVPAAALDEWTNVFMNRLAEISAAQNCKP